MFRKARIHSLANKIQKFMKSRELTVVDRARIQEGEDTSGEPGWSLYIDTFSKFLIRTLSDDQLRTLLKSLESKGGINTDCIIVPVECEFGKSVGLSGSSRKLRCDVLVCKVLRWPDIETKSELKTLVTCHNCDEKLSCANPYHYSRVTRIDCLRCSQDAHRKLNGKVSQSMGRLGMDRSRCLSNGECKDRESSEEEEEGYRTDGDCDAMSVTSSAVSSHLTTLHSTDSTRDPWCSIAYWEGKRRVGRIFDVTSECVNVFYELPQGDGICIGLLDQVERNEYIRNVRRHIGYGFQLTLEHDGIWIYNRSDFCIFVSAPHMTSETTPFMNRSDALLAQITRTPEVVRIYPGHCLHVVNFMLLRSQNAKSIGKKSKVDFGLDVFCIRISFAKGWGRNYKRQFITSCPCWTEIYLGEPCLALIGQI